MRRPGPVSVQRAPPSSAAGQVQTTARSDPATGPVTTAGDGAGTARLRVALPAGEDPALLVRTTSSRCGPGTFRSRVVSGEVQPGRLWTAPSGAVRRQSASLAAGVLHDQTTSRSSPPAAGWTPTTGAPGTGSTV